MLVLLASLWSVFIIRLGQGNSAPMGIISQPCCTAMQLMKGTHAALQMQVSAGYVLLWFLDVYFLAAILFLDALNLVRRNLINCCSLVFQGKFCLGLIGEGRGDVLLAPI